MALTQTLLLDSQGKHIQKEKEEEEEVRILDRTGDLKQPAEEKPEVKEQEEPKKESKEDVENYFCQQTGWLEK